MNRKVKLVLDLYFPNAARIYRRARDDRRYRGLKPINTSAGLTFTADPQQVSALFKSNEIADLQEMLRDVDVFVDLGANVGLHSCIAAKMGKVIVAAEPHPMNLQLIYRNLQQNGLDRNFEVHAAALGDQQRIASFFGAHQGGSLLAGWGGIRSNYETIVPVNTLDRLLEGRFLHQRLLIKVDVEGNEYPLLLGAAETLNREPAPTWMVEVELTKNFGGGINPHFKDIFETFWLNGYRASPLGNPERVIHMEDLVRWVMDRKTDHGDINYRFSKTDASASMLAAGELHSEELS